MSFSDFLQDNQWWNNWNPMFQPNIFEIFPSYPSPLPNGERGRVRGALFFLRDKGFIQFEGVVKSPDRQFCIFGINDAGDLDL